MNIFGADKLIEIGTIRKRGLVGGRGCIACACNSDLEAGGHTCNLGSPSVGSVSLWGWALKSSHASLGVTVD